MSAGRPTGRRPVKRPRRRWLRITLLVLALVLMALAVSGCVVYNSITSSLPDPSKPLRGTEQSTRITDRKGAVITELFTDQNRTNVALKDISPVMRNAIVATEDQRYYQHSGVDFMGMLRAAFTDVMGGGSAAQGGSTITQQYVKKAFLTPEKTLKRKIAEAVLAYRVEQTYSKDKILEMYLNTIYFGHGAYGVSTAAETFFGKPAASLTAPEAALLAGVVKSPSNYSPYLEPAAAKKRRDTVLMQMRDQGYLKPAEYAADIATPIVVVPLKRGSKVAPYFVEYVRDQLVKQYGSDLVYRGGLKVTTTLDLGLQAAAEDSVAKALSKPGDPSAALVTIDPKTGAILAMVGGRDFASQQYNVVTQGHRQPGSAFKPFVLATALDQGVSPEQTYESGPVKIDVPGSGQWSVTGASGGGGGPLRLRLATWDSVNSVFAQLIMQVGADKVAATAKAMGIATPITAVPAIALGGLKEGVTPLEMATAYATLANGGTKMEPFGVLEVRDSTGKVLATAKPAGTKAIDPAVAYLTTDILKGVITQGTAKSAGIGRPAAGKTGTTQEYRDAWFAGYTPDLTTVVWVGFPDAQKAMTSVHGIKVTGGSFPAQIWQTYMKVASAAFPKNDFPRPAGLTEETYCQDSGGKATQYCPKTATGLFLTAKLPADCTLHKAPTTVSVPNLIGMTKDAAIAALQKLALLFKIVEKDVKGATAGSVTDQDVKAGSSVPVGATVSLTVATAAPAKGKPPVAAFTWTPKAAKAGAPIQFDASTSTGDTPIAKYVWEFDAGHQDTTSGKTATHTFPTPGTYDVTLWVTDGAGQTTTITSKVQVQ